MRGRLLHRFLDPWSRVGRHTRLNVAVLGCLLVILASSAALIISVQWIGSDTRGDLAAAEELSVASRKASEAALLLSNWSGSGDQVRGQLTKATDELWAQVNRLEAEDSTDLASALRRLLQTTARLVDAPAASRATFVRGAAATGLGYEALAADLAERYRMETSSLLGSLSNRLRGIQITAGVATFGFFLMVLTQIFPLTRSIARSRNSRCGRRRRPWTVGAASWRWRSLRAWTRPSQRPRHMR